METARSKTARIKSALRQLSGHEIPTPKQKDSSSRSNRNALNVKTRSRESIQMHSVSHHPHSKNIPVASRTGTSNRSIRNTSSIKPALHEAIETKTALAPPGSIKPLYGRQTKTATSSRPFGNGNTNSVGVSNTSTRSTANVEGVESIPPRSTKAKGTLLPGQEVVPAAVSKGSRASGGRSIHKAKQSHRRCRLSVLPEVEEPNEAGVPGVPQGGPPNTYSWVATIGRGNLEEVRDYRREPRCSFG
ncbi:hypothetical protein MMC26_005672 [Xylographa opegraphella]|nr:hypothetical protein [Xylographa opegraphella]